MTYQASYRYENVAARYDVHVEFSSQPREATWVGWLKDLGLYAIVAVAGGAVVLIYAAASAYPTAAWQVFAAAVVLTSIFGPWTASRVAKRFTALRRSVNR